MIRTCLLLLLLIIPTWAAEPGALRFAELGDLPLASGKILREVRVGYRTYGTLNTAKDNAVLFPTWFGGKSAEIAQFVGPNSWLDPSRYFIITVDALANGVSTSPSNSAEQPQEQFPEVGIPDMVESQRRLLEKEFGIRRLHAVVGISMGGMQAFAWVALHGNAVGRAIPVIGSPRLTSFDKLLWSTQRQVIIDALRAGGGDQRMKDAMRTVRMIHELHLRTPEWRVRETAPGEFSDFVLGIEKRDGGLAPVDYVRQLEAMIHHDVAGTGESLEDAAQRTRTPMLVVVDREDEMVRPEPASAFARAAGATLLEFRSGCGHMVALCESASIGVAANAFLAR